jgi:hypothetical protein
VTERVYATIVEKVRRTVAAGHSAIVDAVFARPQERAVMERSGRSKFDAILLDVDNGPEGLTRKGNDTLYDLEGLSAARATLRPAGRVVIGAGPEFHSATSQDWF